MIGILVRKLLKDIWLGLTVVCVLLMVFQLLWAHVTWRISGEILPGLSKLGADPNKLRDVIFNSSGKIVESIMGAQIRIEKANDLMSVAYVHPLTLTILCIWAVGRASAAIAGEIDRGTMELLLAQPIRRSQVVLAHLIVDLITIPLLCACMWFGTWLGTWLMGLQTEEEPLLRVDPMLFPSALLMVACLVLAVSGYSLVLSAAGRSRGRVLGLAILVTLMQFLINIVGQLWTDLKWMRPFTIFYHYQPQPMILTSGWVGQADVWVHLGTLFGVGAVGYLLAMWIFCKRDLPAPL